MNNLILNTDSYKLSHFLQYPPDAEYISSYIESRGGEFSETVFFGLQLFLKQYLTQPITQAHIDQAEALVVPHGLPFNRAGWEYILHTHKGYLPVEIESIPEGTELPVHNIMMQIVNTDPKCAWLTSYLETMLLRAIWYPTTVATVSRGCYKIIKHFLEDTSDNTLALPYKLHDFGPRGTSSEETAAIGGLAHLVNFQGTDNLSALVAAQTYYHAAMAGFSIPAAEHSTITSWGRENEAAAYANILDQFGGTYPTIAVVSDSYDIWHAIDDLWGGVLKRKVETSGSTLVIRPDSGTPIEIVPEAIERLMNKFGFSVNAKGYRVLPPYVRLIQGDGVNAKSIAAILQKLKDKNISADNIAFGIGGELLQKINRDTQRFAMKVSAVYMDGEWKDVFKDPITDPGKRSKKGRLALININNEYKTILRKDLQGQKNVLQLVYKNGQLLIDENLTAIRERLNPSQ